MMALVPLDLVQGPGAILAGLDRQLLVGALFGVVLLCPIMMATINGRTGEPMAVIAADSGAEAGRRGMSPPK